MWGFLRGNGGNGETSAGINDFERDEAGGWKDAWTLRMCAS